MPSIKKNLAFNLLLLTSNLLFPIISFAYAARMVGPAGIGKVQFVITFASYFVLLAQVGIPVYGMREVAKIKNQPENLNKLFSELMVISIGSSFIMLLIYTTVILSVGWFQNNIIFYLLGGLMVMTGFSVLDWFYMGLEKFRFLSLRSIIIKIIALTALFVWVHSPADLLIYFIITLGSVLGNNLWNLFRLKGIVRLQFHLKGLSKHYRALLILYISSLTISIYTLGDTLLLGFLTDNKAVGFYTAAKKLIIITIPIITSLGTVLIPQLTKSIDTKNHRETHLRIRQSFAFISLLGIPVSIGLIVFAPEIMRVFSGPDFTGAILTLQLTAPVIFLVGLGHLFGMQMLIPGGYEKQYLTATVWGMVISLTLNLLLIHTFRDKGAAITLLITEGLVSFVSYYYVVKKMQFKIDWKPAGNAFLTSLIFIPPAIILRTMHLPLISGLTAAISISAILYLLLQYYLFKEPVLMEIVNYLYRKSRNKI